MLTSAAALVRRASPRLVGLTAGLQVVTAVSTVATVVVAAALVRALLDGASGRAAALLAVLAAAGVVTTVAGVVSSRVQRVLGESVARSVWDQVLGVASRVPLSAYDSAAFSERLSRVCEHAVGRPLQVVSGVSALLAGSVGAVGLLTYLVSVHVVLPLLVLVAGVPTLVGVRLVSRREYRFLREATVLYRLRLYTAQLLTGREAAKELRAYGFGGWLRERHERLYGEFISQLVQHSRSQAVLQAVAGAASALLASLALLALVLLVQAGQIDVGAAAGAALALRLLASRVQDLATGAGELYEASLFLEDLHGLPEHVPDAEDPDPHAPGAPAGAEPLVSLTLDRVRFTYPGAARPAVSGIDLELRPGSVVALVGENGSGKTTVTKVVSHLYPVQDGQVLWNGRRMQSPAEVESVRRRVAVLFQDFGRYAFTAADNVDVGDVTARGDSARREASARRAGADAVVGELSAGWETLLAAEYGGQDLSLGQWQRVALARAHFRRADLIILDEPTAALDPRAEARLFDDVRRVLTDKAVLLVTHRLASARTADTILVMRHGEVVERGTHEELMARDGTYAELWALQAAGYAVDAGTPASPSS